MKKKYNFIKTTVELGVQYFQTLLELWFYVSGHRCSYIVFSVLEQLGIIYKEPWLRSHVICLVFIRRFLPPICKVTPISR